MTPATPPRSRERRSSMVNDRELPHFETGSAPPETPHRSLQSRGPVTPSTTTTKSHKELSAPYLFPPRERSPFKGFQSPEFTPFRELKEQQEQDEQFPPQELQKVSRVLFPKSSKDEIGEDPSPSKLELLPPTRPTSSRSRKFSSESPTEYKNESFKQAKQVPGTPSDKLTNFELAKKWYNNSDNDDNYDGDDDEDDEGLIRQVTPTNPFQSSSPVSEETRNSRKQSLLKSNPDVEDVITYLNKDGAVARRHRLSSAEKEAFKPKRLFAKELQELESGNEAAEGSNRN
ncbi:hypothetical protein ZYGR_0R00990 [Zygosaccharomyces rouxii]|uniref:ZYRO0F02332p n=2 Tax=Zygosaccharomyces rouxii TaxID=4956 RepID=C5DX54_ZYGRC|nr:uncharacterized protein ZYRO0F02332g [Zygosaccharomyces rouxii]KAH9199128.1 hypothetical protein LQ764DRAFT_123630 [Zygosaccharomyces rouxii]GAV49856.1 hypothetical protein ZYGR_0R00990 [Zygosaccharomyces rouxii]CAR28365.1 ZYRO0F02332p [Zygosaccharomyces rouxii]